MVGLMGAQFSKPLVANKVTHLICYKFEGVVFDLHTVNTIMNELGLRFLLHVYKQFLFYLF
jgi:topoisomerase (DNA) II binding protein 1